jgi:hypothetical protein
MDGPRGSRSRSDRWERPLLAQSGHANDARGASVRFEVRWAGGDIDRMRTFANELVDLSPDVILASGTTAISMLKQTTRSILLFFVIVNDPLAQGLVSCVAHPAGNVTGFSFMDFSTLSKTLQIAPRRSSSAHLHRPWRAISLSSLTMACREIV